MITLFVFAALALGTGVCAMTVRIAQVRRWQRRREAVRIEREVARAEYQLHRLAGDAFSAMLDAARSSRPNEHEHSL